jgi:hypothetical protein
MSMHINHSFMEFQVTEKRSVDGRSSESINPRKQVSKYPAGVANLFLFHFCVDFRPR